MSDVRLTLAIGPYEHVADLVSGRVRATGIELTSQIYQFEEIQNRFLRSREWDVAEMSFAKCCSLISRGDDSITALPVFPGRAFRHSSFYVRADGPVRSPQDLAGKTVGVPEWTQTAGIYARGLLSHHFKVSLSDINWVQAGVSEPGRKEQVQPKLPAGINLVGIPDRSLNEMLLAGDLDAIVSAHAPASFLGGDPSVTRLFPHYRADERAYYEETGIYPIMHVLVISSSALLGQRWIAMNLVEAFDAAKRASLVRLHEYPVPTVPLPWAPAEAEEMAALFGEDYFPYGIEENRTTIEAFLGFAYEQGILDRRLEPEDLFPTEVHERFRI
jgi:4,5-dihydroxyphthalate decarboxylase